MDLQVCGSVFSLLLLICLFLSTECCEDIDLGLCKHLNNSVSDMCQDPCLSGLCRKSCGQCYLQCYSCSSIGDVSSCNNVSTCPYEDDICFATQTFTDRFAESYTLGCAPAKKCQQYHEVSRTSRITIEAGCCNTNKCNNKPPSLLHINHNDTGKIGNSNYTSCEDIDPSICGRLKANNATICSNDCVSRVCPSTCGRCFRCLSCAAVSNPSDCNATTKCGVDQSCFIAETLQLTSSGTTGFQLGCTSDLVCHRMDRNNQPGPYHSIFGKRFTLDGGCCKGTLCNSSPTTTTTSAFSSINSLNTVTYPQVTSSASMTTKPTTATPAATTSSQFKNTDSLTTLIGSTETTPDYLLTTGNPMLSTTEYHPDCHLAIHAHCPDTFYQYHTQCYTTGPIPLTHEESRKYCERQCLRLAEFDQESVLLAITKHFIHYKYHDPPFYVGGEKININTEKHFIWTHGHLPIAESHWIPGQPASDGDCVVTKEELDARQRHQFGLASVNCTQKFKPLCQMFLNA